MSEMLPEHWKTVRLEEIADVRGGTSFPKAYQGNTEGEYPFYKVSDMNLRGNETLMQASNNWVEKDAVKTLRAKLFSKDTVIFPKVGAAVHTNKKRLLSCDGLVDNNVMGVTIRDYDLCIPYYLLYWFVFVDLVDFSNPGPLPSITATRVKNAKIPLPPLPEQRAIAHVLQTIQEAKSTRQRELALERERKAALMDYLFSHGTKGEPRKQTEIGKIPESWEVAKLGEITEIIMGQSPKGDTYNTDGKGEPLINGPAEFGSEYPTPVQWTSKPTKLCKDGDILFCVRGNTTGRMNIADQRYCIGRGIAAIRERIQKSDTLFIRNLLEYERSSLYRIAIGGGSTFPNISTAHLKNYTIALPSISEQSQIAEILQAFDAKIAALEKEAERLDELFHAMLDELMTGQRSAVPLIDSELLS